MAKGHRKDSRGKGEKVTACRSGPVRVTHGGLATHVSRVTGNRVWRVRVIYEERVTCGRVRVTYVGLIKAPAIMSLKEIWSLAVHWRRCEHLLNLVDRAVLYLTTLWSNHRRPLLSYLGSHHS